MNDFQCLICGEKSVRRRKAKPGIALAECAACGLVQQHPLPDPEVLNAQYAEEEDYMDGILRAEAAFMDRDRRALKGLAGLGASGPLLDVGAGAGTLLKAALDQGWEAKGIEISHPSAEHLRESLEIEIFEQPIEKAPIEPGRFGVVTFSHTLEHMLDPVETLGSAAKALRKGGWVHAAVPNWNAAKRAITGLGVPWIYSHHITYFTKRTLGRALERSGFEPVEWSFNPFIGDDYPFVVALFRRYGIEKAIQRFLHMGEKPLEELVGDNVQIQCPPWRYRAVVRLARAVIRLWPENLLCKVGRSEELRVSARLAR